LRQGAKAGRPATVVAALVAAVALAAPASAAPADGALASCAVSDTNGDWHCVTGNIAANASGHFINWYANAGYVNGTSWQVFDYNTTVMVGSGRVGLNGGHGTIKGLYGSAYYIRLLNSGLGGGGGICNAGSGC
jgi:hypothetical protein